MRWATGTPGDLEQGVLASRKVSVESLIRVRLSGSRRTARLFVRDITIEQHTNGACFRFHLPKGSYATNVMREFMKSGEGTMDPIEGEP